jgi:hypothetical protein
MCYNVFVMSIDGSFVLFDSTPISAQLICLYTNLDQYTDYMYVRDQQPVVVSRQRSIAINPDNNPSYELRGDYCRVLVSAQSRPRSLRY